MSPPSEGGQPWVRPGGVAARALPWLVPAAVVVAGLLRLEWDAGPILKYACYFAGAVALPGTLILRAAWRSTGNWAEDLGLGAVVGACWQFAGWLGLTALGWQQGLVVWAGLMLAVFAAVPGLRRYWRISDPEPLPVGWSWGLALSAAVVLGGTTVGVMAYHEIPPEGSAYYQDLLYHLSMLNELTREVPPELPQVVGERLEYHWFANADMAAAVDITRLSPIIVLYRLWWLPWLVVALLVCATLARIVSGRWWTGVVAAAAIAVPQLYLFVDTTANLSPPVSYLSPSQTFGLVAVTAAGIFLVRLLFQAQRTKAIGLGVLALAAASLGGGAKPTVLPVLLGAVGLVLLARLMRRENPGPRVLVIGVLLSAAAAGTFFSVAGSTHGSRIQLLAVLKSQGEYLSVTGDRTPPGAGGWIVPSLTGSPLGTFAVLGLVLVIQAAALAGFALLCRPELRRQPLAWFLIGALVAGWAGYLLIDHPSVSQGYFVHTVIPFSLAGAGWVLAAAERPGPVRQRPGRSSVGSVNGRLAVIVAALLAVSPVKLIVENALSGDDDRARTFTAAPWWVYPDEQEAATWLGEHSAPNDVVATNTWCRPAGSRTPGCDARGYLVSGIAGRRTLIEGWAYTSQAMANHGRGGLRYTVQASPWPERVALTTQALAEPTPGLLDRLATEYQVRWLFADARAGVVSPRLGQLAIERHSVGQVTIYELRQ